MYKRQDLERFNHPSVEYMDRHVSPVDAAEVVRFIANGLEPYEAWRMYFESTPELRAARKELRIARDAYIAADTKVWRAQKERTKAHDAYAFADMKVGRLTKEATK